MAELGGFAEYLTTGKTALDLIKTVRDLLPAGGKRVEVDKKIQQAEGALELAKANAAKALGYRLCRCTFPPTPMLWDKHRSVSVCSSCGDFFPREGTKAIRENPRGPHGWMAR